MRALLPGAEGDPDLDTVYALPRGRHVRVNFVTSPDGAIEVDGRAAALGSPGDRRIFGTLRGLADVVLVGAGTVRTEDYGPVRLPAGRQSLRRSEGRTPVPPLAVVTRRGLDPAARLFEPTPGTPWPLLLTTRSAARDLTAVRDRAEIVVCGGDDVDPVRALDALAERGLTRVLCEGGPALFGQVAGAGLVDELCLTVAPLLAGPQRTGLVAGPAWPGPVPMRLTSVLEEDGSLFLRYRRAGQSEETSAASSATAPAAP